MERFNLSFIPSSLPCRSDELEQIKSFVSNGMSGNVVNRRSLFVSGRCVLCIIYSIVWT
jgi:hypothetical protein